MSVCCFPTVSCPINAIIASFCVLGVLVPGFSRTLKRGVYRAQNSQKTTHRHDLITYVHFNGCSCRFFVILSNSRKIPIQILIYAHFAFEESCCEPGGPVPILACSLDASRAQNPTKREPVLFAGFQMFNQYNSTKPELYRC